MFFLYDDYRKIAFGWSAKCGCTHVKNLYNYLVSNNTELIDHKKFNFPCLPYGADNKYDYKYIFFMRNPYERIVSGFLDIRLNIKSFSDNNIPYTFKNFLYELRDNGLAKTKGWDYLRGNINHHHFTNQLSEGIKVKLIDKEYVITNDNFLKNKNIIVFDIKEINYEYIKTIFKKKIPESLKSFRGSHCRGELDKFTNNQVYYDIEINKKNLEEYKKIHYTNFFNKELKEIVDKFYKNDFIFLHKNGIETPLNIL